MRVKVNGGGGSNLNSTFQDFFIDTHNVRFFYPCGNPDRGGSNMGGGAQIRQNIVL